jgi:hypothetical protein
MSEQENNVTEPAVENNGQETAVAQDAPTQEQSQNGGCRRWLYDGKPWEAFKTFALIFSFIVNIIFFIVLLAVLPLILPIVNDIVNPIVEGLNDSFIDMNNASITRTIDVKDDIDIAFTLPLDTDTNVVLTQDVALDGVPTTFLLPGNGGQINGMVYLTLPKDLVLPVALSLEVPVNETIPVELAVDVEIPLDETELGEPFNNLVNLFGPLQETLGSLPESNEDLLNRILSSPETPETEETNKE